jgi:hypothetical protein
MENIQNEFAAEATIDTLIAQVADPDIGARLQQVQQLVTNYDYEAATVALQSLLNELQPGEDAGDAS